MTQTSAQGPSSTERVSRQIEIEATPERVWSLVSDLPAMGAYSPENTGGSWVGAPGPRVGAVFAGRNAQGSRRWSTRCTVVRCEPGKAFGFDVRSVGLPVASWTYELAPSGTGCLLTETWQDRRGVAMRWIGKLATGVGDRTSFTATSIEQTLQRLRAVAQQETTD